MLPAVLVLLLVVTALGAIGVAWRPTRLPQQADRGLRRDRLVQALALAAAGLTAVMGALWAMESPLVRGRLAIPLAAVLGSAICYLAVVVVGQLTWPRPSGPRRHARLVPRGIQDVAGPRASRLIGLPLAVAVLAVLLPALLAPLDGPSAGGRAIYRAGWGEPASAVLTIRRVLGLPWPGLRYGFPALLAMLVLLGLAVLALRAVSDRATVTDAGQTWDHVARARIARRITTVTAGALATVGGLFILTTGSRLIETETGLLVPGGGVLLVAGALWAVAGIALAVVGVLWPGRRPQDAAAAGSRL